MNAISQKIDVTGDFVVDGEISILNAYKLPTFDGAAGQILTADGTGEAVWKDPLLSSLWNQSSNNIYRQNGNVGIGLNNPQATLHILEQSNFPEIRLEGSSDRFLKFFEGGVEEGLVGMNAQDLYLLNRKLQGKVRIGAHGQSTLVIDAFGNVGIGEVSPIAKLHLKKDSIINLRLEALMEKKIEFVTDGFAVAHIGALGDDLEITNNFILGDINFSTLGQNRMTILNSGNIGIGTSTPARDLHLFGSSALFRIESVGQAAIEFFRSGVEQSIIRQEPSQFLVESKAPNASLKLKKGSSEIVVSNPVLIKNVNSELTVNSNFLTINKPLFAMEGISLGLTPNVNATLDIQANYNVDEYYGINFKGINSPFGLNSGFFKFNASKQKVRLQGRDNTRRMDFNFLSGNMTIGNPSPNGRLTIKQSPSYLYIITLEDNNSDFQWGIDITNDDLYFRSDNFNGRGYFSHVDGDYHSFSDRALKEEDEILEEGTLEKFMLLKPKKYFFKGNKGKYRKSYGFIAQEVLEIFPDIPNKNGADKYYSLNYKSINIIAVKAIQELNQKVMDQEVKIQSLEERLEKLELMISKK